MCAWRFACGQVDVFNPSTQRTYSFPCDAWLEATDAQLTGCRKELLLGAPAIRA